MTRRPIKTRHNKTQTVLIEGIFQSHPKGFGFVIPADDRTKSDILIPRGRSSSAISGDRVAVRARARGHKAGKPRLIGEIIDIVKRGRTDYVGTLAREGVRWFVHPDSRRFATPIELSHTPKAEAGTKVVVHISDYPGNGKPPLGFVGEILGQSGSLPCETLGIQRTHQLEETFSEKVLSEAESLAETFRQKASPGAYASNREDLTQTLVITIDPASAKDFDDAISLSSTANGGFELGVHIADVSHFVQPNSLLDKEAYRRGTSVYLERKVIPMLPSVLSNGICSLVPGEPRLTKSVFITYDSEANVTNTRFSESIIKSGARLTYADAEAICEGKNRTASKGVSRLVNQMKALAEKIERRRLARGMIQLELPEVDLIYENDSVVIDARPRRNEYSHRIIEMFMVEANEAVCALLDELGIAFLRRSHPKPSQDSLVLLRSFARSLGYDVPNRPSREDIQELLTKALAKPEFYALSLAVLRAQSQAVYSSVTSSHFALASDHYCHFTSPIRRYPDLEVHRHLAKYCQGKKDRASKIELAKLKETAEHCSERERTAQSAEYQLRQILILHYLLNHIGDEFSGIIMTIADQGLYIQHPRFLVEGLLRYPDLGDERWDNSTQYGSVHGKTTGKTYRIGDSISVSISGVNVQRRHLDLAVQGA